MRCCRSWSDGMRCCRSWSDGMLCCRSDWPGLCLFCCFQPSRMLSAHRVDFGLFFCFIQFFPPPHLWIWPPPPSNVALTLRSHSLKLVTLCLSVQYTASRQATLLGAELSYRVRGPQIITISASQQSRKDRQNRYLGFFWEIQSF